MAAIDELRERVLAAAGAGAPLAIRGGGSKAFYGEPAEGEVLDTRAHAGIVAYEPTELYLRARCGTPLAEVEAALAEQGQMLAFEPPHFAGGPTVGGAVAAGLSGPRRVQCGAVRDFVLGVELMDGGGRQLRFGGQVMKNVAGYDVSRLVTGSLGTLGLITEATLKVLPRPAAELSLRLAMPQGEAIRVMNAWAGRPLPISATAWHEGVVTVRLSGAASAVRAAREALGGEPLADVEAREFWGSLRDQTHSFFACGALWRLSVPPTTAPLELPGAQLLEWHGGVRWLAGDAEPVEVRAQAARAGGGATLFRGPDALKRRAGVFQPLPQPLAALHRRVKQAFDPSGIFNPGRLYPEL
jgi:glycolate oxidase FAD binding subunit